MRKRVFLEFANDCVERISSSADLIGEYSWNPFRCDGYWHLSFIRNNFEWLICVIQSMHQQGSSGRGILYQCPRLWLCLAISWSMFARVDPIFVSFRYLSSVRRLGVKILQVSFSSENSSECRAAGLDTREMSCFFSFESEVSSGTRAWEIRSTIRRSQQVNSKRNARRNDIRSNYRRISIRPSRPERGRRVDESTLMPS